MNKFCKFEMVHKRLLDRLGYTLYEVQSLPASEQNALKSRIQDVILGNAPTDPLFMWTMDDEEWKALDDLQDMIMWLPGRTIAPRDYIDDEPFTYDYDALMPVCNITEDVEMSNLGYIQGVLEDGTPFVSEVYTDGQGGMGMNTVLPEIPQFISNRNFNAEARVPDSIEQGVDAGVLAVGMTRRDRGYTFEEIVYYTQYLVDMGILTFTTHMLNGDLAILDDLDGRPVVMVRNQLTEKSGEIAQANIDFVPFPDGPNRLYDEEFINENVAGWDLDSLLDGFDPSSN